MTETEPSASTAASRRTTALRSAMRRAPTASATVTTAGRPSGMAATARLTAVRNILRVGSPLATPTQKTAAHTTRAAPASLRPRTASRRWSSSRSAGCFDQLVEPEDALSPLGLGVTQSAREIGSQGPRDCLDLEPCRIVGTLDRRTMRIRRHRRLTSRSTSRSTRTRCWNDSCNDASAPTAARRWTRRAARHRSAARVAEDPWFDVTTITLSGDPPLGVLRAAAPHQCVPAGLWTLSD